MEKFLHEEAAVSATSTSDPWREASCPGSVAAWRPPAAAAAAAAACSSAAPSPAAAVAADRSCRPLEHQQKNVERGKMLIFCSFYQ